MKLFRLVSSILLAIAAPAFATVTVTTPKAGSTVTSPVQYTATATASTCSKGVASMGIYVNNKKIYDVSGAKLSTSITLATGSQHTVVEEWDKCGAATYTTVNLTVVAKPTVTISASPTSIKSGSSSTLTVKATNATKVTLSGTDGSTYTFATTGGTHAVSPKATTTYTVTATGASGATATATAKVTVTAPPAPTATITATPTSIKYGATSTLKVTVANATAVTIAGSNGTTYTLSATGGSEVVTPTATTTYTATVTGTSGATITAKATVTVAAPPAPTATITATPTSVKAGASSTLKVTATNATTVTIAGSDGSSHTLSATGGSQIVTPTSTTTYTATATGPTGTAVTAKTTVTVTAPPAPTATITATPTTVKAGASSTLKVTATNAVTVTITGSDGSSYPLTGTTGGSQSVSPSVTTTYTATATNASGATASAKVTVTVTAAPAPTVSIVAKPTSIALGSSSTLTVAATNATTVVITGSGGDNNTYTLSATGGTQSVSPTATTTYTATATGSGSSTAIANALITVGAAALKSINVTPNQASFALGATENFTATATYSDGTTGDVTSSANWSIANTAVATIDQTGLATSVASGSTTVTASLNGVSDSSPIIVTIAPGTGVNIPTWHGDNYRSGLNNNEQSLTTDNVNSNNFGKLFSLSVNGYPYAQPLLVSGLSIKGGTHNVLYVATETNDVYAFDADTGTQLWHVTTMVSGESPDNVSSGAIFPTIGITGTPVIDTTTKTMYVVSKQGGNGKGNSFRLNALDITTGAQKLGGPVTISASVPTTETSEFPTGFQTLTTSCIQRTALLEAYGNVYFGFGSCHSGFMLAYDTQTLQQTGVFNSSPNLDGEGQWASAGGVWMAGGGPASNGDGNVYITTGNGPWDGQTAFSDSILQFNPPTLNSSSPAIMTPSSFFTPQDYQYMDCSDGDLAAGGLLLIPNSSMALAGAKTARMYLADTSNLGGMQANDAGALDTLLFESDLSPSFSKTCSDTTVSFGTVNHQIQGSHYEIYSTAAYFNGSVYMGITAEASSIPAGLRQFTLKNNTLTPSTYTGYGTNQEIRGTTPFISANGNSDGVVWMIDQNEPLGASGYNPGIATLRAFDPNNLANELYDSSMNSGDAPGYGIKFTSPIVANGKVYIATGTTLETNSTQTGEIDVYGLN